MRAHPTRRPARGALLAAGLVLLAAGVAVVAWVLASSAGLVGRDDPTMADPGDHRAGRRPADRHLPAGAGRRRGQDGAAGGGGRPGRPGQGLMGRTEVPEGTGMVFLYPEDVAEAYWMKNTLVPLSIAFVAADGRVVSVAEMTPCKADPCPSYPPAGPYRYAVELAAGSFGAAGVGPGAKVVPVDPQHSPNRPEHAGQRQDKAVDPQG